MIINQRIKCLGFLRKLMCSYRASKIFSMAVVMMLFSSLLPSNPFIPSTVSFVRADPAVPDYLFELTIKPDIQDVGNDPLNPSSRSTTYEIEVRNFDTNPNQIKLTIIYKTSNWDAQFFPSGSEITVPVGGRILSEPGQTNVQLIVTAQASVTEGTTGRVEIKGECTLSNQPPYKYVSCETTMNSYEPSIESFYFEDFVGIIGNEDLLYILGQIPAGSVTQINEDLSKFVIPGNYVEYLITIVNNGQLSDIIDLDYDIIAGGINCWEVKFYDSTGSYELSDTNYDDPVNPKPDTGSCFPTSRDLEPDEFVTIRARVIPDSGQITSADKYLKGKMNIIGISGDMPSENDKLEINTIVAWLGFSISDNDPNNQLYTGQYSGHNVNPGMMTSYAIYVFKMTEPQGPVDIYIDPSTPIPPGWSASLTASQITVSGTISNFDDSVDLIVNAGSTLTEGDFCDIILNFEIGGVLLDSIEITTYVRLDKKVIIIMYNGVNEESLNLDANGDPYNPAGPISRLWDDVHDKLITGGSRYTNAIGICIAAADPNYAGVLTSAYTEKTGLHHVGTPFLYWDDSQDLPKYDIYDRNWVGGGTLDTIFNSIKSTKSEPRTALIGPRFYLPKMFYDLDVDVQIDSMDHPYYIDEPQPYIMGDPGGLPVAGGMEKVGASDDWVFKASEDTIRHEDPDFIFIMNTVPDLAGHLYGSEVDGSNNEQLSNYGRITQVEKMLDVISNLDDLTGEFLQFLENRVSTEGKNAFDETVIVLTADHGMRTYYSGEGPTGVDIRQYLFDNGVVRGDSNTDYEYLEGLGGPGAYLFVKVNPPIDQTGTIATVKSLLDPQTTLFRVYKLNRDTYQIEEFNPIYKVLDKTDMQYGVSDMEPTTGQGFHLYDASNPPVERVPDLVIALQPRYQVVAYADVLEASLKVQETMTGMSPPFWPSRLDLSAVGNHGDPTTQHVPLVLHGPGIKQGYSSSAKVETLDIIPTICRINGWSLPNGAQGKGLDCIVQVDTFWYPDFSDQSNEHSEWALEYTGPAVRDQTIYLSIPESGTPSSINSVEILSASIDLFPTPLSGQGIPVNSGSTWQVYPAIYGDKIVWEDYRNSNLPIIVQSDIYSYDLSTNIESGICTNTDNQLFPAIYGDKIVWQDYRNGKFDIYMYDISLCVETKITPVISDGRYPDIYGDKIVWQDSRNGNGDIYLYDLSAGVETPICTNPEFQWYPAIYDDKIVWNDGRNGNYDIYMYDLSTGTETQITTDPADQWFASIYDEKIVWEDYRNGYNNPDIYLYDLSTGISAQITTDPSIQVRPDIYGDIIVWEDERKGNSDIFMYNLGENFEKWITVNNKDQKNPAIYGNKIVWQDFRDGFIYWCDLMGPHPADITFDVGDDGNPEWSSLGVLNSKITINDLNTGLNHPSNYLYTFREAIQNYINNPINEPIAGYYRVPIKISVVSDGALGVINVHIVHTEHEYDRIVNPDNENVYQTIQEAVNAALPGDTIYVYPGIYVERVTIPSSKSSITLLGEKDNKPTIDGSGSGTVLTINANSVTVRDFIIENGNYGISATSDNNLFYNNAFIDNVNNAYDGGTNNNWDNGYPGGGNYWDDLDMHTTAVQDNFDGDKLTVNTPQTGLGGPDGINDYSYIDGTVEDWYPVSALLILTQSTTFISSNWVVSGHEARILETITLDGDMTIPFGSTLNLLETDLVINSSYDGEHTITVDGTLKLISSTISSINPYYRYRIIGTGDIIIKNSDISNVYPDSTFGMMEGNIWYGSPLIEYPTLNLLFSATGGEKIAYLRLLKTADVLHANLDLTGEILGSNYPTNPAMDVGNDGIIEWSYSGELTSTIAITDLNTNPIFSISAQNYLDNHQPDENGYIYVPISISSESEGKLIISNIKVGYTNRWTWGEFSKPHEHPSCYYYKFAVDIYYNGVCGIRIDDSLCPYIDYINTISEENWAKPAAIKHYYYDEDNNNIIDDTTIPESTLKMYWWDELSQSWVPCTDMFGEENTGVNTVDNYVWTNVDHFSSFTAKGSYVPIAETEALIEILESMEIQEGIKNSLIVKLGAALEYLNVAWDNFVNGDLVWGNENLTLAKNKLNDFINEVEAQRGKAIREIDADILIDNTREIIALIDEAYV
jgi:beta propeller repeat protein